MKFIAFIFLLLLTNNGFGQIKAVTEVGDTIYVYDNGTWSFEYSEEAPFLSELSYLDAELNIDTLKNNFEFSELCNKEIEDALGIFTFKYDNKDWERIPPGTLNADAQFAFSKKSTDAWCLIIVEQTVVPSDKLLKIAIENIKTNLGADVELLKTELRNVNGTEILRGVMKTNLSGIDLIFDSYYYSNEKGSVQISSYSGENVWYGIEEGFTKLLNGIVVKK